MGEKLNLDGKLTSFFQVLTGEAPNMDICDQHVSEALTGIADDIRLGRAEVLLDAPQTMLRPQGAYHISVPYDRGQDICEEVLPIVFSLPDGGRVSMSVYPYGKEPFSAEEIRILRFIFNEVFLQYSRCMMQNMLMHVIHTDMDTGVANQTGFIKYVGRLFAERKLDQYVMLFFNIHNFKYVNKVFSYDEGDHVLKEYAQTVNSFFMEDELLGRLGGDNFVALTRKERLTDILYKLQNVRLTHKTPSKEKTFLFGATIGYSTLYDIHKPQEVFARVSTAYQAARLKSAGSAVCYSNEIHETLMENQSVIANFMTALEEREFLVYYQPKVNIMDGTLYGAEALVRWEQNGRMIPPMQFIPQLEKDGSICKLDYYVLEEVCRFLRKWIDEGHKPLCISVNFSRKHLDEDNMVERIVSILNQYEIAHEYIEIELTESEDYQNYELMMQIVNRLRGEGIGTSMDDFGTGFSSLNMIKKLDLNVIKIDKSFIPLETDYPEKEKDMIMFGNIVTLLRKLGKKTIAEGVETKQQLQYIKDVGCDIVQGYVFDKPLSEAAFRERLLNGYSW